MKERNMVTGALILSASALFVRMIGFVFRIYLAGALGAEGMGVHMLIMSMYNVCVTLATSGLSTAVSTLCAEQLSLGKPANAKRILVKAGLLALAVSSAVCVALFAFAGPIGTGILKDGRTVMSLRILAAGLPFLSVSACLRGYFISCRRVGNPAAGQVLEQLVKMAFIMALIGHWLPRGIEYACAVVVMGMTIGEIACFLYSFWGYAQARRKTRKPERADITGVYGRILKIVVPISVSAYIRSFLRLAEDVLILAGLKAFSGRDDVATGVYGMLKGMVMPLLLFPLQLLSSFVITLTPEISRINAAGDTRKLNRTISRILEFTFMAGILVVAVFMAFPREIAAAVYKNAEVGDMLKQLSFLCPLMCIEMVAVGILNGLGQQVSSMRYSIADSVVRIGIIYFLIPLRGVDGFMIMIIISNMLTSLLNFGRLIRITGVGLRLGDWLLKPALAAAATGQIVMAAYRYLPLDSLPGHGGLVTGALMICFMYAAVLFAIGSIRPRDFAWIAGRLKATAKMPAQGPEKAV